MKILLALDDSARTMDEALTLARQRGADLTALFVLDTGWSVYTGHDFLLGSHARAAFLDYTRDDERAQERAAGRGVHCRDHKRVPPIADDADPERLGLHRVVADGAEAEAEG